MTDSKTGLTWMQNPMKAEYMTWYEAFEYIKKLNLTAVAGHTDWRLPNILELKSLINYESATQSEWLETIGFNDIQGIYWSSNTYAFDTTFAWSAVFVKIHAPNCRDKNSKVYVCPVCSTGTIYKTGAHELAGYQFTAYEDGNVPQGIDWPVPRFRDNHDGTVTDNMTGLIWMKNANIAGNLKYSDMAKFIVELNSGSKKINCGYTDWRLPSIEELQTLIHFGLTDIRKWLESQQPGFDNVQLIYWTSTLYFSDPHPCVWGVYLHNGLTSQLSKEVEACLRPVRGNE